MLMLPKNDLFGIYVHWPYCKSKCPYCDFNSHVSNSIDHQKWAEAYETEIAHIASLTPDRTVSSIFFGGGTPSLMKPETLGYVLQTIRKHWSVRNDLEITLEANPTSIEADKFTAFKQAGINRVSVGVQSLRDNDLKFLGREHSAQEAIKALEIANKTFDRVSFDLIYARPEQTIASWKEELTEALNLATGHLSLYQLTIEQGTPFYTQHARGEFRIPEADQAGEFYEVTQELCDKAALTAYEISNHAVAGQESAHNLTYWKYADYAGIGPGAHGRLTLNSNKYATRTHRAPDVWLDKIFKDGHGYHNFEEVDRNERIIEMMMMGLRLSDGIALNSIAEEAGQDWRLVIAQDKMQHLIDEDLLALTKTHLKPTRAGMQRLNGLLSYLL